MPDLLIALLLLGSNADAPPAEPADPVICKKFAETGSLVRKKKICRTQSEWTTESSSLRDSAARFVEERRARPPTGN
jgi:hypothetical protein